MIASEKLVETSGHGSPEDADPGKQDHAAERDDADHHQEPEIDRHRRAALDLAMWRDAVRGGGRVGRFAGAGRPVDGGRGLTWDVRWRRLDIELHCRTLGRFACRLRPAPGPVPALYSAR